MSETGKITAAFVDVSAKALAHQIVQLQRTKPATASEIAIRESAEFLGETELRLRYLAEALAFEAPGLFEAHVEWTRATHAVRGVPEAVLLQNLNCMREILGEELPVAAAAAARGLMLSLESARQPVADMSHSPLLSSTGAKLPHVDLARRFLLALLEGRRIDALALVSNAFDHGVSVSELQMHVIANSQSEVGRMWQAGEIHAGEEHLGSRIVEEALTLLRSRLPRKPAKGRSILCASVQGNLHDIGARLLANQFELEGWTAHFLGANVPTPDLVQSIEDFDVDVLALSVTLGLSARSTADLAARVRSLPGKRVPILVGGRLFDVVPNLWKAVGADAYATDPEEAVRTVERMMSA